MAETADAHVFIEQWLDRFDAWIASAVMRGMVPFQIFALLMGIFSARPAVKPWLVGTHATILLVMILWHLGIKRRKWVSERDFAQLILLMIGIGFTLTLGALLQAPEMGLRGLASTGAYSGTILIAVIVMPYHDWRLFLATGFYLAICAVMTAFVGASWTWYGVFAIGMCAALFYRWSCNRMARRDAVREYETRLHMAPRQLVRLSNESQQSIEQLFRPAMRWCVCISSECGSGESSAEAVESFYAECDRLLQAAFPAGNYYTDWMANELFVVAYGETQTSEKALAAAAVDFVRGLMASWHGRVPLTIGLSCGEAYIGMLGPVGSRKLTALGEVPGRARRLFSTGCALGRHMAPRSRAIFASDLERALGEVAGSTRVGVGRDIVAKDLDLSEILVLEGDARVAA